MGNCGYSNNCLGFLGGQSWIWILVIILFIYCYGGNGCCGGGNVCTPCGGNNNCGCCN